MNEAVPTVGSKLRENNHVEVVAYHKPQKKVSNTNRPKKDSKNQHVNEFNMKEAQKQAMKLGTTGFFKYKREKTLTALAIELGAQPDKKKYKNYKDLKQLRKQQKQKKEQRLEMLKERRK